MTEKSGAFSTTLIHGWDPALYNSALSFSDSDDPAVGWAKMQEFIKLLSRAGTLSFCNLPGFCGVSEPGSRSFEMSDFAAHLSNWKPLTQSPQGLIGFSFGGAVALAYKAQYHSPVRLVLISPAIKRRETLKSHLAHAVRSFLPSVLRDSLKDIYQSSVNKYYRLGTPFLRATYDKIAREDLTTLIDEVPPGEVLFIFGDADTETPWELVKDKIQNRRHNYKIIEGAGHSVFRTHSALVAEAIVNFYNGKST